MRDKLTDAIRVGKVSSIDPVKCTAQVTFEDRDGIVSGDLPIMVRFTLEDMEYGMPAIGERVRVLFDPEAPSKGCILGSYYADTRLPPITGESKRYIRFSDGAHLEYDKRTHALTVNIPPSGTITFAVGGTSMTITSGGIAINGNISQSGTHTDIIGSHCSC